MLWNLSPTSRKHNAPLNKPPDICNGCQQRKVCKLERHIYEAKFAQNEYEATRSESWQGFDVLLMISHINSYTRKKPNNRYTDWMFSFLYGDSILPLQLSGNPHKRYQSDTPTDQKVKLSCRHSEYIRMQGWKLFLHFLPNSLRRNLSFAIHSINANYRSTIERSHDFLLKNTS